MSAREINFDGLVGPTHNYAGLSEGNLASARNANMIARPREAGDGRAVAAERRRLPAGARVPQPDAAVQTSGQDGRPSGLNAALFTEGQVPFFV